MMEATNEVSRPSKKPFSAILLVITLVSSISFGYAVFKEALSGCDIVIEKTDIREVSEEAVEITISVRNYEIANLHIRGVSLNNEPLFISRNYSISRTIIWLKEETVIVITTRKLPEYRVVIETSECGNIPVYINNTSSR